MYTPQKITAKDCLSLRHQVLLPHKRLEDCHIDGDLLDSTLHLGVFDNSRSQPIGIASFVKSIHPHFSNDLSQYRLRQMGVVPEFQKKNIGRILLEYGFKELDSLGCNLTWCHARKVAYGFYESLGFEYFSSEFQIDIIGSHRSMFKRIKNSPVSSGNQDKCTAR